MESGAAAVEAGHENLSVGAEIGYAVGVVALVLGAGLMSGLTLGLLSLDIMDLEVLKAAGDKKQRAAATQLIKLVSKPHWLLCTLLLCNAGCMEALPLLLDRLLNPVGAILLSVTAILVFGEIIPQAVCSRYGVAIGAKCAPMVRALMWVCSPITWPLGKLLDWILGHEEITMKRKELKAMVTLHGEGAGLGGALSPDEVAVIHGAMDLTSKTALSAMTPIAKVFMLSDDALLDEGTVNRVLQSGHSRVPVYRGTDTQDIIGLVLVKELLQFWRAADTPRIGQLDVRYMPHIPAFTPMFDVLRLFQTGNSHMALLMAPAGTSVDDLRQMRSCLETASSDAAEQQEHVLFSADSAAIGVGARGSLTEASHTGSKKKHQKQKGGREKRVSWKRSFSLTKKLSPASSAAAEDGELPTEQQTKQLAGQHQLQDVQQDYIALEVIQPPASLSPSGSSINNSETLYNSRQHQQAVQRSSSNGSQSKRPWGTGTTGKRVWVPYAQMLDTMVPVGIITLEDVMEELLQTEIIDETDKYMDNEQTETVDISKLMNTLPPHLHTMLRAEMLAAAQNFIKTSPWMQQSVTTDLSPTATSLGSVFATAAIRTRANSAAIRPMQTAGTGANRSGVTSASGAGDPAEPTLAPVRVWNRKSDPGYVGNSSKSGTTGNAASAAGGTLLPAAGGTGSTPKAAAAIALAQAVAAGGGSTHNTPKAAAAAAAAAAAGFGEDGAPRTFQGMDRADSMPAASGTRAKMFKSVPLTMKTREASASADCLQALSGLDAAGAVPGLYLRSRSLGRSVSDGN